MKAWPPKGWKEEQKKIEANKKMKPNIGLKILSFIIPIYGLIYFLINKSKKPICAKSYLILSVIGLIIYIITIAINIFLTGEHIDNTNAFASNLFLLCLC